MYSHERHLYYHIMRIEAQTGIAIYPSSAFSQIPAPFPWFYCIFGVTEEYSHITVKYHQLQYIMCIHLSRRRCNIYIKCPTSWMHWSHEIRVGLCVSVLGLIFMPVRASMLIIWLFKCLSWTSLLIISSILRKCDEFLLQIIFFLPLYRTATVNIHSPCNSLSTQKRDSD